MDTATRIQILDEAIFISRTSTGTATGTATGTNNQDQCEVGNNVSRTEI